MTLQAKNNYNESAKVFDPQADSTVQIFRNPAPKRTLSSHPSQLSSVLSTVNRQHYESKNSHFYEKVSDILESQRFSNLSQTMRKHRDELIVEHALAKVPSPRGRY